MKAFYQSKKESYNKDLSKVKKQLSWLSGLRFLIFTLSFVSIYWFWGNVSLLLTVFLVGCVAFIIVLNKYLVLDKTKQLLEELVVINNTEIDCLQGNYHHLDSGEEFVDPTHFYSYDIDLFGHASFFQFLNRTSTLEGKSKVAELLTSNSITGIKNKQKAIEELSDKVDWRQHFSATAKFIKSNTSVNVLLTWLENYKKVFPKNIANYAYVFSVITLVLLAGVVFNIFGFTTLTVWSCIGFAVSALYVKRVNKIYNDANQAKNNFNQYFKLMEFIEAETFNSDDLKEQQQIVKGEKQKVSEIIREFSKILDALDQRNNIFVAFLGNAFFLRDLLIASKVEKWIEKHQSKTRAWFDVITYFDAQNSLANFRFNHKTFIFPELTSNTTIIKAEELGHPLIDANQRVNNSFTIAPESFFIVTGSNMAGKSTFLRTISLSIVMANVGLPLCAKYVSYTPIKLITSMRTSDSLNENTSYFFAELKRLKFVVNALQSERYFILLDEILKGTNSIDKAKGSIKFVEKLVKLSATGMIATHDLSLCEITNTYSQIKNYYFDATTENNELVFDYKLKDGVCENMNASFLLKKMGIV